jgi:hypothetical protein
MLIKMQVNERGIKKRGWGSLGKLNYEILCEHQKVLLVTNTQALYCESINDDGTLTLRS